MKEKKILVLLPVTEEDKEYLVSRASGDIGCCWTVRTIGRNHQRYHCQTAGSPLASYSRP